MTLIHQYKAGGKSYGVYDSGSVYSNQRLIARFKIKEWKFNLYDFIELMHKSPIDDESNIHGNIR